MSCPGCSRERKDTVSSFGLFKIRDVELPGGSMEGHKDDEESGASLL